MNGHPHALREIDMIPDRHVEVGQWVRCGWSSNWHQIIGLLWMGNSQAVELDRLDIAGNPIEVAVATISETMSNRQMQLMQESGDIIFSDFHGGLVRAGR